MENTPEYDNLIKTFIHIVQRYEREFERPVADGTPPKLVELVQV